MLYARIDDSGLFETSKHLTLGKSIGGFESTVH